MKMIWQKKKKREVIYNIWWLIFFATTTRASPLLWKYSEPLVQLLILWHINISNVHPISLRVGAIKFEQLWSYMGMWKCLNLGGGQNGRRGLFFFSKKLVKSNESISWKFFLAKFHFFGNFKNGQNQFLN